MRWPISACTSSGTADSYFFTVRTYMSLLPSNWVHNSSNDDMQIVDRSISLYSVSINSLSGMSILPARYLFQMTTSKSPFSGTFITFVNFPFLYEYT